MRGFTLLELIVVLLVFSVLSVMAYGGLKTVLDARVRVEASLDRTASFQRSYRRLRDDFRQVRLRPVRDGFGDVQPALFSERDRVVTFTRGGWRNPLNSPRPTLERVRYRLTEGTLYRDSWRVLDQAQDSVPLELALLSGVDRLRWRFQDDTQDWRDEWTVDQVGVPRLIELTLVTDDWGELVWLFRPALSRGAVEALGEFTSGEGSPVAPTPEPTDSTAPPAEAPTPDAEGGT